MEILAFNPHGLFRSISITGSKCWLNCLYCRGYYLGLMEHAPTPWRFRILVRTLVKRYGVRGILVSGGFTREGYLPVKPFLNAIREVKRDYKLIVSVHPGLVSRELALELDRAGVDIIDYEFSLDTEFIRVLKGLDRKPSDYIESLEALEKHGSYHIVPHIPLGFTCNIDSVYKAIDYLSTHCFETTVFIIYTPVKSKKDSIGVKCLSKIPSILEYARKKLKTNIALGCMRPPVFRRLYDRIAIEKKLVDRIVNPYREIIMKYKLETVNACCSIPTKYIELFM